MQAPTISELRSKLDQVRAYARPEYEGQPEDEREQDRVQAYILLTQYQSMLLHWFNSEVTK
jgi:hypothetical protein